MVTESKSPGSEPQFSERVKWRKHRREQTGFLWGTWIMLLLTLFIGNDTLQGFRSGEWVDISADESGLLVPWWVAAAMTFGLLLFTLWCLSVYLKLKRNPPAYIPTPDETDEA